MFVPRNIQYITKANSERIAVIIPLKEFESMLAEIGLTVDEYENDESSRGPKVAQDKILPEID